MAIEELGQVAAILNRDPAKARVWADVTLGHVTLTHAGIKRGVTEARVSQICGEIDRQILTETEAGISSGLKRIPRPPLKFPVLA